ncbi:MAG: GNAT family N-acetyltransferase [Gammaproteobacteria bacterium]|nr:MAG: GNAT family N-acetyltransferase [Gammaproteobacteria bacterium]
MMAQASYEISKLNSAHNKKSFLSGSAPLDNYLKHQASQDIKKNVSVTYALTSINSTEVIGYYTLSSISIDASELSNEYIRKLPRYPMLPAILIGRLAVDSHHKGKKIGAHLLIDALKRSLLISDQIGINAVIVDAKDDHAAKFYRHFGFIEFPSNKLKLFLPINTIKALNL